MKIKEELIFLKKKDGFEIKKGKKTKNNNNIKRCC